MNKKGLKTAEKIFRPAFGCAQHQKAGQNTQQTENGLGTLVVPFVNFSSATYMLHYNLSNFLSP